MQPMLSCSLIPEEIHPEWFPACLEPIVSLFAEDCDGELDRVNLDMSRLFIAGHDEKGNENELMLRLNSASGGLVVARIQFIHRRCGYMTRLQDILLQIAKEDGVEEIKIEAVQTKEMLAFCQKNGYRDAPFSASDFVLNVQ